MNDNIISGAVGALTMGLIWLVKHFVMRDSVKRDKRDAKNETIRDYEQAGHVTNEGKRIDADSEAFKIIAGRLTDVEKDMGAKIERLEEKINKLQDDLGTQREMGARKDAQIEHLQEDNATLKSEVDKLRAERRTQDAIIAQLRSELDALKMFVKAHHSSELGTQQNPLNVAVTEGDIHKTGG